ncbi:MAG: hypothetical protein DMF84_12625 [Acidobacteria bacterium]|nr:MAG: hypothetical protein DMF84_12625 [Acidobacteriota bacterium]
MNRPLTERVRWAVVVAFAAAMAWVESACVYYLRLLVDRVQPYQPDPLPIVGALGNVELLREAATLMMLLTTGMLAGRTWQRRIGYMAIAFGVWDILYYVFLWIMSDWPASLLDWDILFLLPLPWWGPVLAPVSIALLMIAWGTLATQWPDRAAAAELTPALWVSSSIGIALALGVFMADALIALPDGRDAVTRVLPTSFNWPLLAVALLLMAAPVANLGWRRLGQG